MHVACTIFASTTLWCQCHLLNGLMHRHEPIVWDAGVCFYQRESLPGYSAIFRHPNDELNYCYYLIPCGKDGMCGDVKVRMSPHSLATSHDATSVDMLISVADNALAHASNCGCRLPPYCQSWPARDMGRLSLLPQSCCSTCTALCLYLAATVT